ncbi:phosphotransferase family protein [Psychrobacter sp. DM8]|uniref:phosphotransferase family protein n=1 Tax=Psychrobacter sp. DM8 TaxID=3440636 RepID=UPI003F5066D9
MTTASKITPQAISDFIQQKTGASKVTVDNLKLLSGGAIQQNWAFDAHIEGGDMPGRLEGVLRADAPSGVAISHGRDDEFALFKLMFEAGVRVPEPLWMGDKDLFDVAFFIMRRVGGTAAAHRLAKDLTLGGDRRKLAQTLGSELAKIHAIRPPQSALSFLEVPNQPVAKLLIERSRTFLDEHTAPYPTLEWVLCWLEDNQPAQTQLTLCHRDYRTGNYMVDAQGLTGILDLEFADWSDPLEDIGWFCAKCWRFGNDDAEAGGIGTREDFYAGYEQTSNQTIAKDLVHYWEVMAHMNWAIIALQQGARHTSGEELSLELALTGHMVPKLEVEMLKMIGST